MLYLYDVLLMISFLFIYLDLKYSGEENMIYLAQEYYVNFPCKFDLVYYPLTLCAPWI